MNILEATADNCKAAKDRFSDGNLDSLFYIRELCAINGVPPDQITVDEFLDREGGILTKRSAINVRFFKFLDEAEEDINPIQIEMMKELTSTFKDSIKEIEGLAKTRAKNALNSSRDQYFNLKSEMHEQAERYKLRALEFRKVSGETAGDLIETNVKSLAEELSNPFWEFKAKHGFVYEYLTPEIILDLKVSPKELIKANLGRFIVKIDVKFREILIKAESAWLDTKTGLNTEKDEIGHQWSFARAWHPFLNGAGNWNNLCVGAEADVYNDLYENGNLGGMIALSRNVLTHYNNESNPFTNPFNTINEIKAQAKAHSELWVAFGKDRGIARKLEDFNYGYARSLWRYQNVIKTNNSSIDL